MYKLIFKKTRWQLLLLFIFRGIYSFLIILTLHYQGIFLDNVINWNTNNEAGTFLTKLLKLGGVMIFNIIVAFLSRFIASVLLQFFKNYNLKILNKNLLQKFNNFELEILNKLYPENKMFSLVHNDVLQYINSLFTSFQTLLISVTNLIIGIAYLVYQSFFIAIFVIFCFFVTQLPPFLFKKRLLLREKDLSTSRKYLSTQIQNFLSVYLNSYFAANKQTLERGTIESTNQRIKSSVKLRLTNNLLGVTLYTFFNISILTVQYFMLIAILWSFYDNLITIGLYWSVLAIFTDFLGSATGFTETIIRIKNMINFGNRFQIQIPCKPKITRNITNFSVITIEDLSFSYETTPVLQHFNYKFQKGKKYGIVGRSGMGKTTLIRLILGLETNYKGTIKIDNWDYKQMSSESLRTLIAFSSSKVFVFDTTIKENITLGEKNDARFLKVIRQANLHHEFSEEELETVNASKLSLGQQQRVQLARTLFVDRPITILDEPFSNLDHFNSSIIKENIKNHKDFSGKTFIIITHHISEDKDFFDEIINFENLF